MAEENKEGENPEAQKAEKQASPLVPALIFAILTPAVTFAVAQFMIVPQIKSAIKSVSAHGGSAAQSEEHATVAEGEGHGEGHEQSSGSSVFEFSDIVANLSASLQSRYIKVSFTVEGKNSKLVEKIEAGKVKYIDAALTILSSLTLKDLEEPGIKNIVRNDLLSAFDEINQGLIEHIYFSEFVVQ